MQWELDKKPHTPVYVQIMELIIEAIQSGELEAGEKIPTERQLAQNFAVNRSTIVHALDEMASLGWIVRKQGSGTRVSEGNWGRYSTPRTNWQAYLSHNVFHRMNPYIEQVKELTREEDVLDLYTGELPHELIPDFQLPNYRWEDFLNKEAQLSEQGYQPLQQAIIQRMEEENLKVHENQLLITSGAQQGLFLILQVLLEPGDSVAVENPSFLYSLPIFQAAGIRLYGLEMDDNGIQPNELKKLIVNRKIKMVVLNPNFQNPTGKTMSLERRRGIIQVCRTYQVPIVEDDVFGDLNFRQKQPTLKSLAPGQVIYLGSLSKILGSSTRVGWICAPKSLIEPLAEARQVMDFSLSIFPQVLATSALTDPTYEAKLMTLKQIIEKREESFWTAMQEFESDWKIGPISGGFYAWLIWKKGDISTKKWQYFLDEGILVAPSFLFSDQKNAFRLNFTRLPEEDIPEFIAKFRKITAKFKEEM